ncbi:hypothetical protein CRE_07846 [Caenorhabditis remanei]|uniref:Uncharacterized protein n=1 Tax=Caenorhabditis remanei TaxID=31234 RepID=E3NGZ4_CAERE|nr:hypothetical protein CRE_07846 [Caenorhabditis remanei]
MIRLLVLAILFIFLKSSLSTQEDNFVLVKLDGNATLPLPASANYRRIVQNANYEDEEHLYRVCNGKNKKTCGFWENVKVGQKKML